jgi:uncharacterized protein (TIGR04255 family)
MEQEHRLPSFSAPPLDEVAADMQFDALPLKAADVGAFHDLIADEYPITLDLPALPPSFETVGLTFGAPFQVGFGVSLLPRSWFISANDEHLVQFQADRLIVNWRMRPAGGAYPRYDEVKRRFVDAQEALTRFVHKRGYPGINSNQCSLAYFNKIVLPENAEWGDLHQLLRGMQLHNGPEWGGKFADSHLLLRRELPGLPEGAFGRLQVELRPMQIDVTQRAWALNLTVRGRPATTDLDGVLGFFDLAHVEIVTCFTAITTDVMHKIWGRQQ